VNSGDIVRIKRTVGQEDTEKIVVVGEKRTLAKNFQKGPRYPIERGPDRL